MCVTGLVTPSTWDSISDWTLADVGRLTILKLKEFTSTIRFESLESLDSGALGLSP